MISWWEQKQRNKEGVRKGLTLISPNGTI